MSLLTAADKTIICVLLASALFSAIFLLPLSFLLTDTSARLVGVSIVFRQDLIMSFLFTGCGYTTNVPHRCMLLLSQNSTAKSLSRHVQRLVNGTGLRGSHPSTVAVVQVMVELLWLLRLLLMVHESSAVHPHHPSRPMHDPLRLLLMILIP